VTAAAPISTSTNGAVKCLANLTHADVPPRAFTRFSP
jgi:hypothetical protein